MIISQQRHSSSWNDTIDPALYSNDNALLSNRTSINAQKITDERHGPFKSAHHVRQTHKSADFSHFYVANSSFKGKDEGCVNSFKALRYYQNEGASYRDELLKEVAAEAAQE